MSALNVKIDKFTGRNSFSLWQIKMRSLLKQQSLWAPLSKAPGTSDGVSGRVSSREPDTVDEGVLNQRELSSYRVGFAKNIGPSEGFMANKGNWLAIQRQLLLLERQQTHLTNMLQDFMGDMDSAFAEVLSSGNELLLVKLMDRSGPVIDLLSPEVASEVLHAVTQFLLEPNLLDICLSWVQQVGAIGPQHLEPLLQTIHECLRNADWATRKAAADTLSALALHSSNLVVERAASTLTAVEASRFDKIKPVRDSMLEALQHWKKLQEQHLIIHLVIDQILMGIEVTILQYRVKKTQRKESSNTAWTC